MYALAGDRNAHSLFKKFASNFVEFITPFLQKFKPEKLIIGGNIAKASDFFLSNIQSQLEKLNLITKIDICKLWDISPLIGSAIHTSIILENMENIKAVSYTHLVVVSPTRAYVQYSESGMEATSGIAALTLSDGAVKVEPTVDGSFGAFTVAGATKGRMVYSRGKVYAGCGQKVIIIDPATDQIIKSIPFEGHQIKGIAKGADGNIYCPLAATYTGRCV